MRVALYVPSTLATWGGGFTFVESLLDALPHVSARHEFIVFTDGEGPDHDGLEVAPLAQGAAGLKDAVRGRGVEAVWFPTPHYEPVDLPFLATVWDLEHRNQPYFPEVSLSGWKWESRELLYRSVLPRAAFVLAGTEVGAAQVVRAYQVPREHVVVAPLPTPKVVVSDSSSRAALPFDPARPFLFYPAQFWPHKNHVALLRALHRLRTEHGLDFTAVFTGADKGNLEYVLSVATELGLREHVAFLGFVDRARISELYRAAFALVFPSYFGPDNLPPLEALAHGCPVIAADVPGAREFLGDAALLVDPRDDEGFARAVLRLVNEPDARAELVLRGSRRPVWSSADYVTRVCGVLDDFAPIRRCWSATKPFVHI